MSGSGPLSLSVPAPENLMLRPLLFPAVLLLLAPGSAPAPSPSPGPGPGSGSGSGCELLGEGGSESARERELLRKLSPLSGRSFNVTSKTEKESYTYTFRVCAPVSDLPNDRNAGLIQYNDKTNQHKVLGRINSTKLIGGSDWIILTYGDGDNYTTHCHQERRKVLVMVSCNPSVLAADFLVVSEEREKIYDCFYLFELDSRTACPSVQSHLSTGSILLILVAVVGSLYLLGGFLYQRIIVQAKGFEQFPNYTFWQEIGNLTADGCDLVCRSKQRPPAAAYRGVTQESLGEGEEDEERDEHLLPM